MGFGELRVLNDDTVAPGKGFGMHFHDNMEIVTIVLKGSLEHKDSTGGEGVLKTGQMQRMTAGKGIQHSEFNPSKSESVHFLQIWVIPEIQDLEPEYEQKDYASLLKPGQLTLLVSPKNKTMHYSSTKMSASPRPTEKGKSLNYTLSSKSSGVYIFLIEGEARIADEVLRPGDAAEVTKEKQFSITTTQVSLVLFIETV